MTKDELLELADRCERERHNRALDIAIEQAVQSQWPLSYTTSLDAAVTLVPPDCWRETNGPRKYLNIPTPSPNRWKAEVTPWKTGMPCFGWAETEAMAICAAALRARASLTEKG